MKKRRITTLLAALALVPLLPLAAPAYPDRNITLVQGFNVGGNADIVARIVANALSKELKQQVLVEARTGAGGNLASGQVSKAPADGYTLILLTGGHAVSAAMYKQLPFDPVEGFEWLSLVTRFPFVLAVSPDSPYKSVAALVAAAKARPGELSFSSVGIGSTQHLSGELFQSLAGIQLNHIPYRGGAAPLQDVLGGRVDMMFDSVTVTRAHIEAGKLRGLGVTAPQSAPQLPGVPPIQASVPGFEVTSWTGLAAPKGLPPAIAQRLRQATAKVLADPEVVHQLEATGGTLGASRSGAEMKGFVAEQVAKWKKVVQDAGVPLQ
ncbi:MAG TPA: tripartite tricarboxylate transporter substrate binding protein [Roseateles sp.]|nr:tripartite tricarboxylate transporter substrate binding protein [Roseateles sp.]